MVLAAAGVARFLRGNSRPGALAMAGGGSIGAGICRGLALRLGFRLDGARHTRAHRSAAAIGGGGVLPLREKPHVRGFRNWMDRVVGGLRTRQPSGNRSRRGRCLRGASVCGLVRRAHIAQEVRRGVYRVLATRAPLVAAIARVGQVPIAATAGWLPKCLQSPRRRARLLLLGRGGRLLFLPELVQRQSQPLQPGTSHLRVAADADAEMLRHVEVTSRHDSGFVLFCQ